MNVYDLVINNTVSNNTCEENQSLLCGWSLENSQKIMTYQSIFKYIYQEIFYLFNLLNNLTDTDHIMMWMMMIISENSLPSKRIILKYLGVTQFVHK